MAKKIIEKTKEEPKPAVSNLVVLERVHAGLSEAIYKLKEPERRKIWLMISYGEAGSPELHELADMDALKTKLRELQDWQNDKNARSAGQDVFYHIFYGERWLMQLGDKWGVYDGQEIHPIEDTNSNDPSWLDYDGRIAANLDVADVPAEDAGNASEDAADDAVGDPQTL